MEQTQENKQNDWIFKAGIVLIFLVAVLLLYNQWKINVALNAQPVQQSIQQTASNTPKQTYTEAEMQEAIKAVIPTGIPAVYGAELKVSFDDPINSMNALGRYDEGIKLSGAELKKYIAVTTKISCEFCCGVPAITTSDGRAACSCAHSGAMRGLAKYLVSKHNAEYTESQILDELQKWKSLFFPQQMTQRYLQQKYGSKSVSGLPQMVGGC